MAIKENGGKPTMETCEMKSMTKRTSRHPQINTKKRTHSDIPNEYFSCKLKEVKCAFGPVNVKNS